MSNENQFSLNVLKYEDIRSNIIDFIKKNSEIGAKFDYDGHNIAMMVDAMTYTDMILAYHLTNISNNIFLDTTTLRKNAVSIAKLLGYRPKRSLPAQISGNFIYKGKNFKKDSFIIMPPRIRFMGVNNNLPYINFQPVKLTFKDANTLSGRFILYQGIFKEFRGYGTGTPFQTITIPNKKISEFNLSVFIKKTNEDDYLKKKWEEVKTFFEINKDNIYFVEEDIVNEFCPKIIFGSGEIGKIPTQDEEIIIEYFETEAEKGNAENQFVIDQDLEGIVHSSDIDFNPDDLYFDIPENRVSFNGKSPETLEEIKINAIKYFSTAGRAVTAFDYKNTIRQFSDIFSFNSTGNLDPTKNIYDFSVLGAEQIWENPDTLLGNIYITGIPKIDYDDIKNNSQFYLEDWQEVSIGAELQHLGIVSTQKMFIKPTYILTQLKPKVEISNETPKDEIKNIFYNVIENLKTYYREKLSILGQPFRKSKVQAIIDDTPFVLSSDLNITFNFLINYNSFYLDRPTILFLPIIFQRDKSGNIIYDKHFIPKKQRFIKKNSIIVEEENKLIGNNYTVYSLPPKKSSIFGKLTHPNIERYLYSKDVKRTKLIKMYFVNDILVNERYTFLSPNGDEVSTILVESGTTNVWNLMFNKKIIANIIYSPTNNNFTISLSPEQEEFLKNLGFILPLHVIKKVETLDNGDLFEFFELVGDLSNIIADIRFYGFRKLGKLTFEDNTNNLILKDFVTKLFDFEVKSKEGNDVSLKETNNDIFLQINNTNVAKIIINENNGNTAFSIEKVSTSNFLNNFGFKEELIIDNENNIIAIDMFNESSIGEFNYENGRLYFYQIIEGYKNETKTIKKTINDLFNNYEYEDINGNKNIFDTIRIIPENKIEDGKKVGIHEDFDSLFSTLVVHEINDPEVKEV